MHVEEVSGSLHLVKAQSTHRLVRLVVHALADVPAGGLGTEKHEETD